MSRAAERILIGASQAGFMSIGIVILLTGSWRGPGLILHTILVWKYPQLDMGFLHVTH